MEKEPVSRRVGATSSASRAALVRAAEQLLLDEGYAAVTSRRVAAKAGLKPQLVHYYFPSMDDLFIEVFRANAEANLVGFEAAVAADPSLTNLWRLNSDSRMARFSIEFVTLAHHRKAIRGEIARYAERFRTSQLNALGDALVAAGITPTDIPAEVALVLLTGISQVLSLEEMLGVTSGHAETVAYVHAALKRLEPQPGDPPTPAVTRPAADKRRSRE
jgi:AcrR family transcriptional regulator